MIYNILLVVVGLFFWFCIFRILWFFGTFLNNKNKNKNRIDD